MQPPRQKFKQSFLDLPQKFAVIGTIVYSMQLNSITVIEDGIIRVENGKITSVGNLLETAVDEHTIRLTPNQFLMPGLVDTHIHAPQYPNKGLGYDKTLLDWLATYTYPTESKYDNPDFAAVVYNRVVDRTLQCGTTTACYFTTIHHKTATLLGHIAAARGQRALVGKVCMNRCAPQNYCEDTASSLSDTKNFIKEVSAIPGGLVSPVITPRFAISCDMELMKGLGELAHQHSLHIQTHISENASEVEAVAEMFPGCNNYADVYDKAGLLTNKTVLAHAVLLTDSEVSTLQKRGTSVAHCPTSNICLRSGTCPLRHLLQAGVTVGLGTDVSGGCSESLLDVMRSAMAVSIQRSFVDPSEQPLNYQEVFYLATKGGADALALSNVTGHFSEGLQFDALIVDLSAGPSTAPLPGLPQLSPLEMVHKFVHCGDDRNIVAVFVAGREVKVSTSVPTADGLYQGGDVDACKVVS